MIFIAFSMCSTAQLCESLELRCFPNWSRRVANGSVTWMNFGHKVHEGPVWCFKLTIIALDSERLNFVRLNYDWSGMRTEDAIHVYTILFVKYCLMVIY